MEKYSLRFLSQEQVKQIGSKSTPVFVYSRSEMDRLAKDVLAFKNPFGLTVRYAMKANPHPEVLKHYYKLGIGIDASSGPEAERALDAGVPGENIMLTTQQLPDNLEELVSRGVLFNASSLHQLEQYGKAFKGGDISIRINFGPLGKGGHKLVTTSGLDTSFGIWHEHLAEIKKLVDKYNLKVWQVHSHAASTASEDTWSNLTKAILKYLDNFEDVTSINIGGGFKIDRMHPEHNANLGRISKDIYDLLSEHADKTGQKLKLEIEPGTYLSAEIGTIIAKIIDVKDTGVNGYNFIIINAGLTEIMRPALYGYNHPLIVVSEQEDSDEEYIVCGHACETADTLTVKPGDPDTFEPRLLTKAKIGDYLVIEGAGAYCATMSVTEYNLFPAAKEVFVA